MTSHQFALAFGTWDQLRKGAKNRVKNLSAIRKHLLYCHFTLLVARCHQTTQ